MPVFPGSSGGGGGGGSSESAGVIQNPQFWAGGAGREFWLGQPNADLTAAASATNPAGLDGWGWTVTSVSVVEGGTGDFLSAADNDPSYYQFTTSGDLLRSPKIFGGRDGALMASKFMDDVVPTAMELEFYASFPVTATNEQTTFIGLGDGASATASCAGAIVSDGANFRLRSNTGNDAGAAVDTAWHLFRIVWDSASGLTSWYIDDALQGTITLDGDAFPNAFKVLATNNDILVAWARIKYLEAA